MTTKLLRLAATVLVLALVAFLMFGCGEETPPPAPAPTTTAGAVTTAPTATTKSAAESQNRPESLIGQTIVPTDQSPQAFKKALENRQPVIVIFYMVGPPEDYSVLGSVLTFESTYKGRIDFFSYLFTDAEKYGDLVTLLKVNSTPTVVVINRQGKVQRAWTGFVDYKSIEQAISEVAK